MTIEIPCHGPLFTLDPPLFYGPNEISGRHYSPGAM